MNAAAGRASLLPPPAAVILQPRVHPTFCHMLLHPIDDVRFVQQQSTLR